MKNKNSLSAFGMDELISEINNRERMTNIFPLDVFHDSLRPFIHGLTHEYDIPRSYVGLTLLSCYSTAIGTSYAVSTNGIDLTYLCIWGALEGISSSGKSLVIDKVFESIFQMQQILDIDWQQSTNGLSAEKIKLIPLKKIFFRDSHIPTLVRDVLPDNPKGILKYADEIMEWLNGMNQLSKREGIDQQFWLSTWNSKPYSGIRSGKQTFNVPRPFVNVIGGIQPSLLPKLFAQDRDVTGFVFRILFGIPEVVRIANPKPGYSMPAEFYEIHNNSIKSLYHNLIVTDPYAKPKICLLSPEAIRLYDNWCNKLSSELNQIKDFSRLEVEGGIYGKVKEYVQRFSAILQISDLILSRNKFDLVSPEFFPYKVEVTESVMERAIRLGNYFYESAKVAYNLACNKAIAPPDVLELANLVKKGLSYREIGKKLENEDSERMKQDIYRRVKKYSKEYPRVFGSIAK